MKKKFEVVIFFLDFMKMNEKQYEYYFVFAMCEINTLTLSKGLILS